MCSQYASLWQRDLDNIYQARTPTKCFPSQMPPQDHGPHMGGQGHHNDVLCKARSTSIYAMLSERRLRWLGHVSRMDKGRIPKDLLYGQLECGTRSTGRPQLRFKESCKRDLLSAHMDINTWEDIVVDRPSWRHEVKQGIDRAEQDRREQQDLKRQRRKESSSSSKEDTIHVCTDCAKDCHSRIGLYSHRRRCSKVTERNPSSAQTDEGQ
ncbi:hypothetical protein BSL78_28183 [Apostichopus japonicus]|uniref:Uncharacterized protein n=1 Tax=Stichopus japonicus TaxID=307972 RepID=A0A2G8JH07_STIJA|nr:hypothetical protein BSL78_28183 [Apostichopus japonicus]